MADEEVARDLARRARELLDGLDGMDTEGLLDPENAPVTQRVAAVREFDELTQARLKLSLVLARFDELQAIQRSTEELKASAARLRQRKRLDDAEPDPNDAIHPAGQGHPEYETPEETERLDEALVQHVGGEAMLKAKAHEIERGDYGTPMAEVFADLDAEERREGFRVVGCTDTDQDETDTDEDTDG